MSPSLLAKMCPCMHDALREWRNTPRFDGLSPSQWLTGHRQKTDTVAAPNAYRRITDNELKAHEDKRGEVRDKVIETVPSRALEPLKPGQKVLVQCPKTSRWSIPATIETRRGKRSYLVSTNSGNRFLRNRRFLRPDPSPGPTPHGPGPKSRGPGPMYNQVLSDSTTTLRSTDTTRKQHNLRPRKVTFKNLS